MSEDAYIIIVLSIGITAYGLLLLWFAKEYAPDAARYARKVVEKFRTPKKVKESAAKRKRLFNRRKIPP